MAYPAGAAGTALAPVAPVEIDYPSSDGEPLAESYFQLIPLFYAFDALRRHYAARDDVFVAGALLLYYQEGNPAAAEGQPYGHMDGAQRALRRVGVDDRGMGRNTTLRHRCSAKAPNRLRCQEDQSWCQT